MIQLLLKFQDKIKSTKQDIVKNSNFTLYIYSKFALFGYAHGILYTISLSTSIVYHGYAEYLLVV